MTGLGSSNSCRFCLPPPNPVLRRRFTFFCGAHDEGIPGLKQDHNGNFTAFDFDAQARGVLANVRAILEQNDARWEDLVDITVYLTDMKRDFGAFNRIYKEHFENVPAELRPCRTTVEVGALPTPIAIELKCVASLAN